MTFSSTADDQGLVPDLPEISFNFVLDTYMCMCIDINMNICSHLGMYFRLFMLVCMLEFIKKWIPLDMDYGGKGPLPHQ